MCVRRVGWGGERHGVGAFEVIRGGVVVAQDSLCSGQIVQCLRKELRLSYVVVGGLPLMTVEVGVGGVLLVVVAMVVVLAVVSAV